MTNGDKPSLVVITGPTASGKTQLAISLAKQFDGEIINADSVQVYRDFSIGSWKPSEDELDAVPHHLVSSVSPEEEFNAGVFCNQAREIIQSLSAKNKLPVIVGGTGLYIRALLCGLVEVEQPSDTAVAAVEEREQQILAEGKSDAEVVQALHEWLAELDPETAAGLHPSDSSRIRRALQVRLSAGESLAELQAAHGNAGDEFRALVITLLPDRSELYELIDRRVEQMLSLGLLEEVQALVTKYDQNARPFGAIGYRQVVEHLRGDYDHAEMVRLIQRDTRRFAKRQLTWWRNQPQALGWSVYSKNAGEQDISDYLTRAVGQFLAAEGEFTAEGIAFCHLRT